MQEVVQCLSKHAKEKMEERLKRGWFVVSLTSYGYENGGMIIVFEKMV